MNEKHLQAALGERRCRLAKRFRKQQEFSKCSSPLSAVLCGIVADFLSPDSGEEEISSWLVDLNQNQSSFALPMLLLAALHREILGGHPDFASLARYYPTVGGYAALDPDLLVSEIRRLLLAHQDVLARFISTSTVQTNETARGLCWLLPLSFVSWKQVSLVDLGCSAGLNLVADQRGYSIQGYHLGKAENTHFQVDSEGTLILPPTFCMPDIAARIGCDLHPLVLQSSQDVNTLASFVWGDQEKRLQRLKEGIRALQGVAQSVAPVELVQAKLPGDLSSFLNTSLQDSPRPVVIYNTYLRSYLGNEEQSFEQALYGWGRQQKQPVLWLQWELPPKQKQGPELGWLAWTAELIDQGRMSKWFLGWVHPHGLRVQWERGVLDWKKFWLGS
nr:DUF2332 family protein [uncultured Desulfobulbus sp.]